MNTSVPTSSEKRWEMVGRLGLVDVLGVTVEDRPDLSHICGLVA